MAVATPIVHVDPIEKVEGKGKAEAKFNFMENKGYGIG